MPGYGVSYWSDRTGPSRRRAYPAFRGDDTADAVIIGGGLTGCLAAFVLAKPREALRQAHGVPTVLRDPRLSGAGNWLARHLASALARELSHKDLDSMLQAVAYGRVDAKQVARRLSGNETDEPRKPSLLQRVLQIGSRPGAVRVDGHENVVVRFAKCCTPLPGDPVQGFITRGRGVTVHQRDCTKIFHLDPERRVPVEWSSAPGDLRGSR